MQQKFHKIFKMIPSREIAHYISPMENEMNK